MAAITMYTSPSGKSFITRDLPDLEDPTAFVFKKAIHKYGFERFSVETLWDDDDEEVDEDYLSFLQDELIEQYNPEYNIKVF